MARRDNTVRILHSFPEPRPTTNPYIVMLRAAVDAAEGVAARTFSWRDALTADYDVFHVHWPEILVQRGRPATTFLRRILTALLVIRWRIRRTAIVRTMHNLEEPTGIGPTERALLRAIDRQVVLRIVLNETTPLASGVAVETIRHGHYRDWFARYREPAVVPGRFGYFGLIRRYKAVDTLVRAFRGVDGGSLHIAGRPSSIDLERDIADAAGDDPRIDLRFAYISDEEIVHLVGESSLVVLPYREMHNSGGALTALSLDRPVLVPANATNDALAEEVGPAWVQRYSGDLTADHLSIAAEATAGLAARARPDLSAREWDTAGEAHAAAYRRAVALRRRQPLRYSR